MKHIILTLGQICSGKTTLSKKLHTVFGFSIYPVSTVVKNIVGSKERSKLQDTVDLAQQIATQIIHLIEEEESDYIVIEGIRQPEIFKLITSYLYINKNNFNVCALILEVSEFERCLRYSYRNADKDVGLSFADANEKDASMGLISLLNTLRDNPYIYHLSPDRITTLKTTFLNEQFINSLS